MGDFKKILWGTPSRGGGFFSPGVWHLFSALIRASAVSKCLSLSKIEPNSPKTLEIIFHMSKENLERESFERFMVDISFELRQVKTPHFYFYIPFDATQSLLFDTCTTLQRHVKLCLHYRRLNCTLFPPSRLRQCQCWINGKGN